MTSATVELWKDTGYTEGCLEVPKTTSSLSSPDFEFENLEIPTSSLFSELKIRDSLSHLLPCSYLRLTLYYNSGGYGTFYGWIDKVSLGSDSEGSPMTRIQWHVDLWRTYIAKVTLGAGIVKRRTASGDLPPQSYGNRYTLAKTARTLITETSIKWVFLNVTRMVDGKSTTTTLCYPVDANNPSERQIGALLASQTPLYCPSFTETMNGAFDELFGLDPDAIYSAFISPISPCPYLNQGGHYVLEGGGWTGEKFSGSDEEPMGASVYNPNNFKKAYTAQTFTTMAQTTDTICYVVTDFDRETVGALPWGLSVSGGSYRIINADTAMYLSIRFTSTDSAFNVAPVNGLEYTMPLKTIGVSTNAKSSYVYSGQQELDREQMAIQRQQSLYSGLASTLNQAVQGAMGGAMIGIASGGSAAMGAQIGGASSGAGGLISTVGDYFISGWANDKMMDATIRQKASQTSYLTLPSSGIDWVVYGAMPQLIPLQWDDYSITQRTNDMTLYGAHVDEPRTSCQSLLTAGGPLQIANCTVTGSVPPEAKRYIKERLASGVRIV